jgi:O-antigen ligase
MNALSNTQPSRNTLSPARLIVILVILGAVGALTARFPPIAFLCIAVAAVVMAIPRLEAFSILLFWTLPYMVVNLPTGAFTLKLPEVIAYLFAAAFTARALLRKQQIALPPATFQVVCYLAVLAIAAAFSPAVPAPYYGTVTEFDRNGPNFRSTSIIIWLGLSWLVVIALYNVLGDRPALFWRAVRAHILSGGVAALISLFIYILALGGFQITNIGGQGVARSLVVEAGQGLRLAGVAYEPLFLAFYLVTVIPVAVVVLLAYPQLIPRWVTAIALTAQLLAILLTSSSGGWMALIVALLMLLPTRLLHQVPRRAKMWMAFGGVITLGLIAGVVISQKDFLTLASSALGKVSAGGDEIRKGEWAAGYGMFVAHPVIGIGPGMSSYHFPRYHPSFQSQNAQGLSEVNNLYLTVLAETGLIGMIVFGWAAIVGAGRLATAIRQSGMRKVPVLVALTASLVGCAIQYMSLNSLFLIYFCGLIGLACAAARVAEAEFPEPAA